MGILGRGLSAQDCFEIGKAAYNARDYYHTLLWMQEAIDRLPLDRSGPKESDVLEYLAFALYHQGNPKRALSMTKRIVEIDPYHPRAEGEHFSSLLMKGSKFNSTTPNLIFLRNLDWRFRVPKNIKKE